MPRDCYLCAFGRGSIGEDRQGKDADREASEEGGGSCPSSGIINACTKDTAQSAANKHQHDVRSRQARSDLGLLGQEGHASGYINRWADGIYDEERNDDQPN